MSNIRFIGDIHGMMSSYLKVVSSSPHPTVQVGDYGIGFVDNEIPRSLSSKHRFIRGNHDNPDLCKQQANWIKDGTIEDDLMFIGGATSISIDKAFRTPGLSWWPNEQLSERELFELVDKAEDAQPRIMVTHECPEIFSEVLCYYVGIQKFKDDYSITRLALQEIHNRVKPDLWVFGHWHHDVDMMWEGTRFICLNELSYIDIDTDNVYDGEIDSLYDKRFRK